MSPARPLGTTRSVPSDTAHSATRCGDCAEWLPNVVEQRRYVVRLNHSYPGVRDVQLFMSFVKHVLTAYKAEVKRRMRWKRSKDRPQVVDSDMEGNNDRDLRLRLLSKEGIIEHSRG
ncbi:hypothetical protein FN846DRAFT_907119 [Sphaerosporella brunnea]|uniref:Uncharacterized protein n=1 Tax=Sphaerosporella brunnea TaxID=1250544 RepID=A0A5J5EX73_9PEZI|nr:hypothetical protein FN846DRAFT_907119 [Sphaerosporella brunnea]